MILKIYCTFFILLFLITIGYSLKLNDMNILGIELSWKMPIVDKELDQVFNIDGTARLYQYKEMQLYQKEDYKINSNRKSESIFTNWFYIPSDQFGLKYNIESQIATKFNVDSFLIQNAFKNVEFYNFKEDSLVTNTFSKDKKKFLQKYIPKIIRNDDTYPDTMIYYFDRTLMNINYSFAPELEKHYKAKIVKILGIYNPVLYSKIELQRKRREMVFELKKIEIQDKSIIKKLFIRFENDKEVSVK